MKKIKKLFYKTLILFSLFFSVNAENNILKIGDLNAKVTVKVFSSLTCPHCANFHTEVFNKLKNDFIDKNLVKFEHHAFPLDLAAFNAEIIVRCHSDNDKKFLMLEKIYENQSKWAVGSDINKINDSIKKIGKAIDMTNDKMDSCLEDNNTQDDILNQRINAQKKYKIESTPTILINEKKYTGKIDYEQFKRAVEKKL